MNRRLQQSISSPRKNDNPSSSKLGTDERRKNSPDDPRLQLVTLLNRKFIERGAREASEAHRDSSSGSVWLARAASATGPPRYHFPPFEQRAKRKKVGFSVCDPSSWIDFAITSPRKTRDLVPVPSFPTCCAWKVVTRVTLQGNWTNLHASSVRWTNETWRGSWPAFSRAIVRSTCDGWWRELLWFIVPGFTSIYLLDIYICISCDGFIDTYGDVEGSTLCWNKRESFIYMCI